MRSLCEKDTNFEFLRDKGCLLFTQTIRVEILCINKKDREIWRNGRMTRYKVCPNQLNRLKRTEKLHCLKSQPIFSEAFQTQPVHRRCFIFLFVPFGNIGERARKKKVSVDSVYFILPPPLPSALAVNKSSAVFIFITRARRTLKRN